MFVRLRAVSAWLVYFPLGRFAILSERGVTLTSTPADGDDVRYPDDEMMVPDKRAAEIAAVSRQWLRYWEKTDLIKPDIEREISPRNVVRLYSLPRLVELVAASELRH